MKIINKKEYQAIIMFLFLEIILILVITWAILELLILW